MSIRQNSPVPPHIAFHQVIGAERAPKVCRALRAALVGSCHAAREHAQLAEAAKRGNDLLGQAIGEHILPAIRGVILERQDSHCGRARIVPRRRQGSLRMQDHVAAAGHGADEIAAGIAQQAADLRDALGKRIVRDGYAGPIGGQ
ncbi:MAG: hypothetical protein WDN50_17570 [Bradyrhizobium sp.]